MKFSIITPAWNAERWMRETIESVLSQEGTFAIEYILVTDPSSDHTIEIAKEYRDKIISGTYPIRCLSVSFALIERHDQPGMSASINEGFAHASGDVYAWIAADDVYKPGAFAVIKKTFDTFPEVTWLKGKTSTIDESGDEIKKGSCQIFDRTFLQAGVYGMEAHHVEQDSVFWRAELWHKGGMIPTQLRSSGDYWLWISFSKYARLWSIDADISSFRKRRGQASGNIPRHKQEQRASRPHRSFTAWRARLFFFPYYNIIPESWRRYLNTIYPFLFPYQSLEYVAIENNIPVKRIARSFVIDY